MRYINYTLNEQSPFNYANTESYPQGAPRSSAECSRADKPRFNLLTSILITLFTTLLLTSTIEAKEKIYVINEQEIVNINFSDLEVQDFIELVSNILNKNILFHQKIRGKVEFLSTTPVYKDDIFDILLTVLEQKGYTLIDKGSFFEVVRTSEASKSNLPIYSPKQKGYLRNQQMITQNIHIDKENVDIVASKIRHLISKSAKLITIKENNSFLITDFPSNIKTLKKAIDIIQENLTYEVKFLQLKFVDVNTIVNDLNRINNKIFNQKITNEKVEVIPNKNTNNLIVVGLKKNIKKIEELVLKMDVEKNEDLEQVVEVVALKHSEAKKVAGIVNGVAARKKYAKPSDKPTITADEDNNALIMLGAASELEYIKLLIKEIDKEKQQVFVKARIIEISENQAATIGAKYGVEGGMANSNGLFTLGLNTGGPTIAISQALSSAIRIGDLTEGLALGAGVDFLKSQGAADIISEPSILCIDNKESEIYVGRTQSILTSAVTGSDSTSQTKNSFKREDIGLTLKIKPRISNDNKVTLDISVKTEDVLDASGGGTGQPTTTKREIKTVALVNNGESVIVGGLIKGKNTKSVSSIPLLGDIPILGRVFQHHLDGEDKINLVVMLTPYVVSKSSDLSELRHQLYELESIQQQYNDNLKEHLESGDKSKHAVRVKIKELEAK